jgi:hypothetical protein
MSYPLPDSFDNWLTTPPPERDFDEAESDYDPALDEPRDFDEWREREGR